MVKNNKNRYENYVMIYGIHIAQRIQEEYPTRFQIPLRKCISADQTLYVIKQPSRILGNIFGKTLVQIRHEKYANIPGCMVSVSDQSLRGIVDQAMTEISSMLSPNLSADSDKKFK